jgi:Protein of unknown function (DUF1493)
MNDEIYKKVVAQLRTRTPLKTGSVSINPETEIYADLKIYGDDLFEFLIWISDEFGVQVIVAGGKYAPSEMPFFKVVEAFKRAVKGQSHRYKSLKVRDVVQAIEAGGGQFD